MDQAGYTWSDVLERKNADPIHILLDHSDCEGHIDAKDCGSLADRLEQLIYLWSDEDEERYQASQLINGMRMAGSRMEPLRFL
jgi:hypothetical protein